MTLGLTHVNTTCVTSMISHPVATIWCELLHAVHTPLYTLPLKAYKQWASYIYYIILYIYYIIIFECARAAYKTSTRDCSP